MEDSPRRTRNVAPFDVLRWRESEVHLACQSTKRRKSVEDAVEPIATVSLHATLTCRSCLSAAMSPDAKRYWSDPFGL